MSHFFNWIAQVATVTRFALATIPERKGASAAAAVGIAGVVVVLVGVLSIARGFHTAMTATGRDDRAIVLRSGADTEMMSNLTGEEIRVVEEAPGLVRGASGPMLSPELFVVINLPKRSTGTDANVPLRGVTPAALEVRDAVEIVEGRMFEPGLNEIVVGRGAAREFEGLDLGARLKIGNLQWEVVGIVEAQGGMPESEIWADAAVVQGAYQRRNSYQAAYAQLESADSYEEFKGALTSDPRLNVRVTRETDFYADQSTAVSALVTGLGIFIAGMMALGAVFGAINTMYTAVAARTREIATLRALGFGRLPIILSILIESVALALAGGVLGAAGTYFVLDGFQTTTMNFQTFSQVTFAFRVTAGLLIVGVLLAGVLGLVGGLFPAIRAARLPVATALREL